MPQYDEVLREYFTLRTKLAGILDTLDKLYNDVVSADTNKEYHIAVMNLLEYIHRVKKELGMQKQ